jgi:hypothetical protein
VNEQKDEEPRSSPQIEFIQEGELSQSELEEVLDILAEHLLFQRLETNHKDNISTRKGL